MMWQASSLLQFPELVHGMSDLSLGNMSFGRRGEGVIGNRRKFLANLGVVMDNTVGMETVHRSALMVVGSKEKGKGMRERESEIKGVDGLGTSESGVYLFATYADCAPVFVYEREAGRVYLVHAGWRGVVGGVIPELARKLREMGGNVKRTYVAVGPHLGKCCFEVGEEVGRLFGKYGAFDGKWLDLGRVIRMQLEEEEFDLGKVEVSDECTLHQGEYYSHRRAGNDGANGGVIGLKE